MCKIVTTKWIYDKTLYIQLQALTKPWRFYTIQHGVDGHIVPIFVFLSSYKVVELVGGGSVINGATQSSFFFYVYHWVNMYMNFWKHTNLLQNLRG